jgi:hypothetical protein
MDRVLSGAAAMCVVLILTTSCSTSRLTCSKFYTYRTNKIDIKGISTKLKKQGVDVADVGIAEISIDPKYVVASEKLQELDLLQYSLCAQIRGLPKKDSLRKATQLSYINALQDMMRVAQKPDSLLQHKVAKLEQAESMRSAEDKRLNDLKSTPPRVAARLVLDPDKSLRLQFTFLKDVPIIFDYYINEYGSNKGIDNGALLDHPIVYPTKDQKTFDLPRWHNLNEWNLSKDSPSKITLHFTYESMYYRETLNPALKFKVIKSYLVDPVKVTMAQTDSAFIGYK